MKKIGVGIIGCGWAGRLHAVNLAALPGVKVVAACDAELPRAAKLADELGAAKRMADYEELIALPEVDAVVVATPNFLHAPVSIVAARAGRHVLVEKPMCLDPEEGQRMVQAADASGVVLLVGFNQRFEPDSLAIKRFAEGGWLGEVYFAKAGWVRRRGIPVGAGGWFADKARSGGGPLIDLGVHVIDLTMWLMGNPKPVAVSGSVYSKFAEALPAETGMDVEDMACGFVRFENGASMLVETSWAANVESDGLYSVLMGTKGGAQRGGGRYPLKIMSEIEGILADITPVVSWEAGSSQAALDAHFVSCVRGEEEPVAKGEHGLAVARVIDGVYRSAATGAEVRVD